MNDTNRSPARHALARSRATCWALAVVWLFCDAAAAPAIADEPNVTIEQVLKVWQDRQAATKSLKVTWTEQRHYEPGSLEGREARPLDDQGRPFPREALDVQVDVLYQIDGDRHRYETKGDDWDDRAEAVVPKHFVDLFDRESSLLFIGVTYHDLDASHSGGFRRSSKARRSSLVEVPELVPIMANYRAFAAGYGHFRGDLWQPRSISRGGLVDGRDCWVIEFTGRSTKRCWVAPELGYRIVRFQIPPRIQVDVQYKTDAQHDFVPVEWQSVLLKSNERDVLWSRTISVREFNCNGPSAPGDFAFEFPPGTEVADTTKGAPPVVYAIKEGGVRRIVTPQERMVPQKWADVLATEEGELAARRNTWHYYATWGALAVLAVVTVVLALRLRRRHSVDTRP